MKLEFSGKRALVLGGSCKTGCVLAQKMKDNGIFPLLSYKSCAGLKRLEKTFGCNPAGMDIFPLDFSRTQAALSMLEKKISTRIDYLVDFAQGDYESLVASADDDAVRTYFNDNITFRALAVKRISRAMLRQKKGKLIFISSIAAKRPNPGQGFYAAAKLASEALYKNTGLELGAKGITTLVLRPGYIASGRGKAFLENKEHIIREQIPTGQVLEPGQVADAVMFFLSDHAGQFNAAQITLDSGFSAGKK